MSTRPATFGDFQCAHCRARVSSAHILSGVNNRNHCPYCLWSRHLDLFAAGDRLSACKAPMRPVGLTMKKARNKYPRRASGELMLIHQCTGCNALSINRIAADDDAELVLDVFQASLSRQQELHILAHSCGITVLGPNHADDVCNQLYGRADARRLWPGYASHA